MTSRARLHVLSGSAALVLAGGLVVAATVRPAPPAVAQEAVASSPRLLPTAVPTLLPEPAAPMPAVATPVVQPVGDSLGPPPGPQVDQKPEQTAAPADRYALLVGVQHYPAPTHDTTASVQDVAVVRDALLAAGWLPQNIQVLTDGAATGSAVRQGLSWLAQRSTPGTFTFFHYSGHVRQLGGTTEGLWPVDSRYVPDVDVARLLAPGSGRLWVDIAGCEAGSFSPGLASGRVLVTASSAQTQKSYEYPPWGTSVWTGLLFQQAAGQADADHDGVVTMGEALRWSTYYAQKMTLQQRPHGRQTPEVAGYPALGWTLSAPPA